MKKFTLLLSPILLTPMLSLPLVGCTENKIDPDLFETSDFDYLPTVKQHKSWRFDTEQQAFEEYLSAIKQDPQVFIQDFLYDEVQSCKIGRDRLISEYGQDNVTYYFTAKVDNIDLRPIQDKPTIYPHLIQVNGLLSLDVDATYTHVDSTTQDKIAENQVIHYSMDMKNVIYDLMYYEDPLGVELPNWSLSLCKDLVDPGWEVNYKVLEVITDYVTKEGSSEEAITVLGAGSQGKAKTPQELESVDKLNELNFDSYYFQKVWKKRA